MRLSLTFAAPICVLLFASALSAVEPLKAGVAVKEITPPKGYRMSGYFFERFNTGTHDPLSAKALVLEQGKERAAIVCCDLIGLPRELTQQAREEAAKATGIPATNILICATHSHTGPLYWGVLRDYFHERAKTAQGTDSHEEVDYAAQLRQRLVEAIAAAQKVAKPTELAAARAEQQGLSFNRRFHMKDGTVVFNPGKRNPNIVRVAGPIDPDVGILRIGGERPEAVLTVFALHLDTVGGTEYSADYPQYLQKTLAAAVGPQVVSLFAAGTCGDINHIDVSTDRAQGGQGEAERIGTTLGNTVAAALKTIKPIENPKLAARSTVLNIPVQRFAADEVKKAREQLPKVGTRELGFLQQVLVVKTVEVGGLPDAIPLEVQVFRLSDDAVIVGLPGEMFVDLGLAIKRQSPFPTTLVIELANATPNYIPTKKAFAEGSYETVNSVVKSGGGEQLVDAAVKMLAELKK